MATEIVLPQWGMEMQDGTIVRWLKREGDAVAEGEPIVEVETAKLQTELESTASGILTRIVAGEGEIVPIRGVLCVIGEPGEGAAAAAGTAAGDVRRTPVVPAARRLARERGIDLARISGSGPQGRILIADVEAVILRQAQDDRVGAQDDGVGGQDDRVGAEGTAKVGGQDVVEVGGRGVGVGAEGVVGVGGQSVGVEADGADGVAEVVPLTGIRRVVAGRMLDSLRASAQVTLTTEANVTEAMRLRRGLSRHQVGDAGGIGPLAVVVKAAAESLRRHPRLNAIRAVADGDGGEQVRVLREINIGLAVALDEGLVTPVIRQADGKSLARLAAESRDLAERTRAGRPRPEEISGGTFTITNLGANEIDAFTPIINPPQVAILGVGRVAEKPIIVNGEVVKGETMYLSLTFDHCALDGAPAAAFLQTLKGLLEDPWWMVG